MKQLPHKIIGCGLCWVTAVSFAVHSICWLLPAWSYCCRRMPPAGCVEITAADGCRAVLSYRGLRW